MFSTRTSFWRNPNNCRRVVQYDLDQPRSQARITKPITINESECEEDMKEKIVDKSKKKTTIHHPWKWGNERNYLGLNRSSSPDTRLLGMKWWIALRLVGVKLSLISVSRKMRRRNNIWQRKIILKDVATKIMMRTWIIGMCRSSDRKENRSTSIGVHCRPPNRCTFISCRIIVIDFETASLIQRRMYVEHANLH